MKKMFGLSLLVLGTMFALNVNAQRGKATRSVTQISNLTEDQKTAITELNDSYQEKRDDLSSARLDEIKALMTEEQQKEFDELYVGRNNRFGNTTSSGSRTMACVEQISSLTEEQETAITELNDAYQEKMAELRIERRGTSDGDEKDSILREMEELRSAHHEDVKALMTEEQQTEFTELLAEDTRGMRNLFADGRGRFNNQRTGRGEFQKRNNNRDNRSHQNFGNGRGDGSRYGR